MNIYGIGTDIVNINRLNKAIKKYGIKFKKRIFSPKEIIYCEKKTNSIRSYAKRFAAKEAFSKALGTGFNKDINLNCVEVVNNKSGKPLIKLSKKVSNYLKRKINNKKYYIYLSLSDDIPWAQATVIISYK